MFLWKSPASAGCILGTQAYFNFIDFCYANNCWLLNAARGQTVKHVVINVLMSHLFFRDAGDQRERVLVLVINQLALGD